MILESPVELLKIIMSNFSALFSFQESSVLTQSSMFGSKI